MFPCQTQFQRFYGPSPLHLSKMGAHVRLSLWWCRTWSQPRSWWRVNVLWWIMQLGWQILSHEQMPHQQRPFYVGAVDSLLAYAKGSTSYIIQSYTPEIKKYKIHHTKTIKKNTIKHTIYIQRNDYLKWNQAEQDLTLFWWQQRLGLFHTIL